MKAAISLAVLMTLFAGHSIGSDQAAAFFQDRKVHEIRLYFDNPNWYNALYQSHQSNPDDPYFPARFVYGDLVLNPIGVRFKGNSSFRANGVKKGFKLDFNEFQEGTSEKPFSFFGMTKLSLNNGFSDPTLLREALFLDFIGRYIPAIRATFVRLYVNDKYYGLYSTVEMVDMNFIRSRLGKGEDGNLFEGERSDAVGGGVFGSNLAYLGPNPQSYFARYQLKSNEKTNDWTDFVEFIDVLNNTPAAQLPQRIEPIADVENLLIGMAANLLFVNLDSYSGSAHNYYLYDRDDTGKFIHLHWDTNETFGTFTYGFGSGDNALTLDPLWLPKSGGAGQGQTSDVYRPLMQKLWAVDKYKRFYLRVLAKMLREGFDDTTMDARIQELADRIRPDVYADPNYLFTPAQFEKGLKDQVTGLQRTVYGLLQFVRERHKNLRSRLDSYAEPSDVQLNELMTLNATAIADNAGDYDPWIELHNLGPGQVNLSGFSITDDAGDPAKWALPGRKLADGEFLVLWLDGETAEGDTHANFRLNPGGGSIYLYFNGGTGPILIDSVSYPALTGEKSLIRAGNLNFRWLVSNQPTAGGPNPAIGINPAVDEAALLINEFMANNKSTIEDPDQPGAFEDWIEIYNPGSKAVDMSGMHLTDSLAIPTKWKVPQGITIPPQGYLVFWADNDPKQGPLHTNFRLAADGEEIGLYSSDGKTLIDSIVFDKQMPDVSFGRRLGAVDSWSFFNTPTPGAANKMPSAAMLRIAAGGAATASTAGGTGQPQAGYATVSLHSGTTPHGTAVFSLTQNKIVVSEAGVPPSPPTTAARIFIDYRSRVPAKPAEGMIDIATGFALANVGGQPAGITFVLRGVEGSILATGQGTLGAGAHVAKFIHQLREIAPDFNLPPNFDSTIGFGSLDITSSQPLSVLALRLTINQRDEVLLTSTPIVDLIQPGSQAPLYFPQLADGGGYVTTIILLNTSELNANGVLRIFGGSGSPLEVTRSGGSRGAAFAYSIRPQGVFVFETDGLPSGANVGSVRVDPDPGSAAPIGAGIFRFSRAGVVVTESGVAAAIPTTRARIHVDRSSGHDTGLAVAAVDSTALTVTFKAFRTDGSSSSGSVAGNVSLSGNGHRAAFVGDLVSGLPDGFTGLLDLEASTPFVALTLRSLTNARNDFLLTTFPVADLTRSARSPIIFPQIADGGGYSTQFILLSGGEATDATINIFGSAGTPLAILR